MGRCYVYHLIDPRNGEVFYVGKGTGNRICAHEKEAKRGVTSEKCKRIREIWADQLPVNRHVVKIFECDSEAFKFEAQEICRLPNLTNIAFPASAPGFRMTDDFLPRLAFLLRATNGLKDDIELQYSKSIGSVGDALVRVFNKMGYRKWADLALREWLKVDGRDSVNARLAPYGITVA